MTCTDPKIYVRLLSGTYRLNSLHKDIWPRGWGAAETEASLHCQAWVPDSHTSTVQSPMPRISASVFPRGEECYFKLPQRCLIGQRWPELAGMPTCGPWLRTSRMKYYSWPEVSLSQVTFLSIDKNTFSSGKNLRVRSEISSFFLNNVPLGCL